MFKKLFLSVAIAATLAPSMARSETREVRATCPDGQVVVKTVDCMPGQFINVQANCAGKRFLAQVECTEAAMPVAAATGSHLGDWSLGLSPVWTKVKGGPQLWNAELQFAGNLRMAGDWMYFAFRAGPGVGWVNEATRFTLSEFAGVQFRPWDWLNVDLGARHRVAFGSDGDTLNALMGELGLRAKVYKSMTIGLFGGLGNAWFPAERTVPGLYPAGFTPPREKYTGKGLTSEAGVSLEYRF